MVISNPLTSPTTPPAALLDALLEQLRRGEAIDLEALVAAHPADASEIRQLAAVVQFVHEAAEQIDPLADLDARVRLSRQKPTLGDFRVVREIARGGMGVVYEAHQLSLDRKVALKVLLPGVTVSPRALERFVREAKTAGVLQHNHIVPVYYVGEHDAIPYFAMQYIEGVSLAEELRAKRAEGFKPDAAWFRRVATWGRQIADALRHAHGQAVIHRDIKPSNVLLAADDDVWVTDFGLARHDGQHSLTLSGDLVGTVRYMSPEQARGGGADERSDVYALGVTLYELASLRPAFDAESREAVLKQVLLDEPRRLGRVDPSIPRPLATIIHQAMEKRPEDRYATAADLGEDLRRFLAGERLVAQPPSAMEQLRRLWSKHKAVSSLAALLLATLTVFAASMTWQTYRLANQRDRLAHEVERHGRVSDFLQSILALANPHTSGFDFTMSEALDEAVARIEPELLDDPLVEAEVRATVAAKGTAKTIGICGEIKIIGYAGFGVGFVVG